MVIFHGYVKLPEGIPSSLLCRSTISMTMFNSNSCQSVIFTEGQLAIFIGQSSAPRQQPSGTGGDLAPSAVLRRSWLSAGRGFGLGLKKWWRGHGEKKWNIWWSYGDLMVMFVIMFWSIAICDDLWWFYGDFIVILEWFTAIYDVDLWWLYDDW